MADNISITAGSGTVVAADDVSGVYYQRVKLVDGTLDSSAAIPGSATDGLLVNLGTNNDVTVTGTVTATQSTASSLKAEVTNAGTFAVQATCAQSTASNLKAEVTNAGTFAVQATLGTETTKVIGTVNVAASQTIGVTQATAASLNCTEASAASILTSVQLIDNPVIVDDSAFTPATSSLMMAGFTLDNTATDLVDEGDAGAARITADRKLIVQPGGAGANDSKGGGSKTDTTDQAIMAAGGAGVYNYLQWVTVYNASSTNTYVNVKDGSTVVAVLPLPAYGGALFQPARAIRGTANTAWNLAAGASVTTAYLYGGGYTSLA